MTANARGHGRNALYLAFTAAGVPGGLFARDAIDTMSDPVLGAPAAPAEERPAAQPTVVFTVNAVLELPTATPSPTPNPLPTPTPGTPLDFCTATPEAGQPCTIPQPPLPTPTPYPDCNDVIATPANGGDICVWPTEVV